MPQKCMECFRLLLEHLAWIEHQFLSGIRDSRKAGSRRGMMRGVGGVRKSIHHSWLSKGLGLWLGLLCWGFKGVQEEISSEEARTLQIGSVAFSTRTMHQSTTSSLSQTIWARWASRQFLSLPVTFAYSLSSKAVIMRRYVMEVIDVLTQEDFHGAFQMLLEWCNKCIAAGGDYFEED